MALVYILSVETGTEMARRKGRIESVRKVDTYEPKPSRKLNKNREFHLPVPVWYVPMLRRMYVVIAHYGRKVAGTDVFSSRG